MFCSPWKKQPEIGTSVELYISRLDVDQKKLSLSTTLPTENKSQHNRGRIIRDEGREATLGDLLDIAMTKKKKKK